MPSYAVSFEIASNSTYAKRYRSLVEQIQSAPGDSQWDETTSFALVETSESLSTFADRLYYSTEVNARWDILLVFNPNTGDAIARGPIKYPHTLAGHFRSFQKK